ncbi:MAG: serine/threonine protein kinase [Nitrospirae bacterium]|nr:serine/threonine protein kinase [Nitrospirota bacterium]
MKIRDYEIDGEPIGRGGMGCVYKAHHINLGVYRAIKELRTDTSAPADMVRRFLQEARIQVQLKHPNIVEVFDCFEEDGKFYIVMEIIEGVTLKTLIERYYNIRPHKDIRPEFDGVVLDIDTCSDIISQGLDALYYAHSHNTVHRDIKPANILLTKVADGSLHVKLADFGIAKCFQSDQENLTKTGIALGTVHYMAPEQVAPEDFGPFDHRADIYAMGVMVFELLTGTYPFGERSTSEMKVLTNKIGNITPNLLKYRDTIPSGYYHCIEKAIQRNPGDRFQDAREFKEAFLSIKDNSDRPIIVEAPVEDITNQVSVSPVDTPETNWMDIVNPEKLANQIRQDSKNKKRYVVLAVVLVFIVIAVLLGTAYKRGATPKGSTVITESPKTQPTPTPQQVVPQSDVAKDKPTPETTPAQGQEIEDKADDNSNEVDSQPNYKSEKPVKKKTQRHKKTSSYITPSTEEIIKKK